MRQGVAFGIDESVVARTHPITAFCAKRRPVFTDSGKPTAEFRRWEPYSPILDGDGHFRVPQAALARATGYAAAYISEVVNGRNECGRGLAKAIDKATDGEVSVAELMVWEAA